VSQISPHLPPADTLLSIFELGKGMRGIWKYSFSLPDSEGPIITVQGDKGTATLNWSQATLKRLGGQAQIFKGKENN
jgi:hypothetical protein